MSNTPMTIRLADEAATERVGRAAGGFAHRRRRRGAGWPLGRGQNTARAGRGHGLGVDRRDVVSPTFVLVHEYRAGSRPIIHIDAYRINDDDEFLQLGAEEYYRPPNLVLIEWASRIVRCLPDEWLEIAIEVLDDTARRMEITGHGAGYEDIARRIGQDFGATGNATE